MSPVKWITQFWLATNPLMCDGQQTLAISAANSNKHINFTPGIFAARLNA
jgi:hypothetical protein